MNRFVLAAILIGVAGFAFVLAGKYEGKNHNAVLAATPVRDTQWEYLVITGGRSNVTGTGNSQTMSKLTLESGFREMYPLERNFDKLGAEGWELVSVVPAAPEFVYYFKRAKGVER